MTWRLIYDGENVINLLQTDDITATRFTIFESESLQDCLNQIDKNKLTYLYCVSEEEGILFSNGLRTYVQLKDIG